MTVKLSLAALAGLRASIAVPAYDRASLSPGILHIGVGNFHRAHQAVYLDRLFNTGEGHDWAIVGAGVKSFDATRRAELAAQDWLSTVVDRDAAGMAARVTGAMIDFLDIGAEAIIARLADPAIRIVSLTITEGGYFMDPAGGFDAAHPAMARDAAQPANPQSVFGILLAGLQRRRAVGHPPFTILSCDNLPRNGHVTRQTMLGLAAMIDPALRDWLAGNVAFPDSMVDCITPATSAREKALVADSFGIEDAAPVACEPFRQWVMEDNFPLGRPALEKVGVQFVDDVLPYETMKLRILNAGHAAIAYPSALLGHEFVHDAMADPDIAAWLTRLMRREVIPVLAPIAGVDYDAYLLKCAERFANPAVADKIARLCLDGSNRQPKFVLPTVADALDKGAPVGLLALEVALWCRYCAETAGTGAPLEDERAAQLQQAAMATRSGGGAFLGLTGIFGDLGANPLFARAFAHRIAQLWDTPVREVLRSVTG